MRGFRSFSLGLLVVFGLGIFWFACRKNFDLRSKEGDFGELRLSGVRFDVSLDPSFLTAYGGRFRCLVCGTVPCKDGCVGQTGGTTSSEVGNERVHRVLSGKLLLVLLKGPGEHRELIQLPIVDSSRPQLLLRPKVLVFKPEQVGQDFSVEKALVIDAEDSTILASPLRTAEACLSQDKCRYRDSLVDSAYRLPIKFKSPDLDSGILVVPLRMSLAGKGLWNVLPPDSLGYTAADFKSKTLGAPNSSPCSGCP